MIIQCKTKSVQPVVPAGQLVNRVGKYLYKHLDGAFKFKISGNTYDVWMTVLYQIPPRLVKIYKLDNPKYLDVNEMTLNLNITTYQNKIRVNVIEVTPEEKTIGFDVFPPEKLQDLRQAYELIYNKVVKRVSKEFEDFEFLF